MLVLASRPIYGDGDQVVRATHNLVAMYRHRNVQSSRRWTNLCNIFLLTTRERCVGSKGQSRRSDDEKKIMRHVRCPVLHESSLPAWFKCCERKIVHAASRNQVDLYQVIALVHTRHLLRTCSACLLHEPPAVHATSACCCAFPRTYLVRTYSPPPAVDPLSFIA